MLSHERITIPAAELEADTNIRFHYPINKGIWIAHPGISAKEDSFCRYTLEFNLETEASIVLHITADNRFELHCDDTYIGMGPDRSDIYHWSFHSYRLTLEPGHHTLSADVHFLTASYPFAQTAIAPAFVLYAEDAPVDLNTGSAPWKVIRLQGVSAEVVELNTFCVVGPNYIFDAKSFFVAQEPVEPISLQKAGRNFGGGNMLSGWKLIPSRLPEQIRRPVGGGRIRAICDIGDHDVFPAEETISQGDWPRLIQGKSAVTIPAKTSLTVLWDLEDYHTAYPELTTTDGAGASIQIHWAESCFLTPRKIKGKQHEKGNRNEIAGKYFLGLGDTFLPDGQTRTFRPCWWRSGRYIRIRITTGANPLTLESLTLMESRMPLENESSFTSNDRELKGIIDLSVRGIQMCAHETYMDCPYYEQMMYVGDTRIQMLTAYVMSSEDRLNQRALELFDWSRRETGFVLERHPSRPTQLSATFAMIWILMLQDYGWWRNNPEFMKKRLKGMRCLLEEFKELQGAKELVPALPGWSFMDWVEGLSFVNNPGPDETVSSVVNLLFLNALNAAAEIEDAYGEKHLAAYNRAWANRLSSAIESTFWNDERALFAENPEHTFYTEHSQCLALLSHRFVDKEKRCFESLITADDLARTTVYFSFYLLESLGNFGRGDLLLKKLEFWKDMVATGFKTPVETPEPSRSDCHGWGSHPLFHMHASLAGIRPASARFASVRIAPKPGSLTELASTLPHPEGAISFRMQKTDNGWNVAVHLPGKLSGTLHWQGKTHAIKGKTELHLPI